MLGGIQDSASLSPAKGVRKNKETSRGASREKWGSKRTEGSKAKKALRQSALGVCVSPSKAQMKMTIKKQTQPEMADTAVTPRTARFSLWLKAAQKCQ